MFRELVVAALAVLAAAGPAAAQAVPKSADQIVRIDAAAAKKLVDAGEAILVDVRHVASFRAEHPVGAVHLPLEELAQRAKGLPRGKTLITYCT